MTCFAEFPLVRDAKGGPSPDGRALLVEAETAEGGVLRFAVTMTDVQHIVAFLLITAGKISARQGFQRPSPDDAIPAGSPIPATSISIGESTGDEGYLGIAVGEAELVFSVPISVFDRLGRTLLTIGVRPDPRYTT